MSVESANVVKKLQSMRDRGYLSDPIIREAVKEIKEADEDTYDWVGVYLVDRDNNRLWLHNYIGEPTEHAHIEIGQGVCGTAVADGENQNIGDVSAVDNYLACSPDTKSELVVLIRAGDDILGQIDIDSDEADAFSDEDEDQVQRIADKLAEVLMAESR